MYTVFNILTALMWSHAAVCGIDQIYHEGNSSLLPIFVLIASGVLAVMQITDLLNHIEDKHNKGVL